MEKLKKIIIEIDYGIKNFVIKSFKTLLYGKTYKFSPSKILICRTGFIGDIVCALPAMLAIKSNFPSTQIDLLTKADEKNNSTLLQLVQAPQFNSVINYFGVKKIDLYNTLKKNKYDLFIDLTQYDSGFLYQLRNLILIRFLGINKAFGWKINTSPFFKKYQENNIAFVNEQERLLNLLISNGLTINNNGNGSTILISESVKKFTSQLLLQKNINDIKKNIGIVIGSKHECNKWPISHFKQVIEHFTSKFYNILIFGSEADVINSQKLHINKNVLDFCGILTITETAEMIKNCSLIITNDTGPMHIASSVGTPLVAIFSSRDFPNKWYPPLEKNMVIRSNDVLCSICLTRQCYDNVCMKKIKPQAIISAANQILNLMDANIK